MISLAISEIIKRRLFRAREHLSLLDHPHLDPSLTQNLMEATYEFTRALKLPAVKHLDGQKAVVYVGDAISNLTTAIDYDLTSLDVTDADEAVIAAQHIMTAINAIPLPAKSLR